MTFATHQNYRGTSTQFEFAVSQAMEAHLLAFMKDPVNGPPVTEITEARRADPPPSPSWGSKARALEGIK
jgi:hypothetical protein